MAFVPDEWKVAVITPVHKKGPTTDCSNYRPISITCVTSKLLERIIVNQIKKVAGTFVPKNFRSWERKFHRVELSFPGTFIPWNFCSHERKFQGTFVPWNFRSLNITDNGKWFKRGLKNTLETRMTRMNGYSNYSIGLRFSNAYAERQ